MFEAAGPKMVLCSVTEALALPTALVHESVTVTGLPLASAMLLVAAVPAVTKVNAVTTASENLERGHVRSLVGEPVPWCQQRQAEGAQPLQGSMDARS